MNVIYYIQGVGMQAKCYASCPHDDIVVISELMMPMYGYMLPNLSPSPNLYKVQSVYNNNVYSFPDPYM